MNILQQRLHKEALLTCQLSHTVPKDRPQERRTHVLFQPPTVAHISDRNKLLAEEAHPKFGKQTLHFYLEMS